MAEWPERPAHSPTNASAAALVAQAEAAGTPEISGNAAEFAAGNLDVEVPKPQAVDAALDAITGTETPEPQDGAGIGAVPEFTLDPEVPDDIADLLAEPDDEPDYEAENADEPDYTVAESQDEYEDPEVARLRREHAKLKKRAEHLERENLKRQRKAWVADAAKAFPLAATDDIQATTRKQFLREAQARHNAAKPTVEKFLQQQQAAQRKAQQEAWGPAVSHGNVPSAALAQEEAVNHQVRRGSLSGAIRELMKNGQVDLG